MRDLPGELKHKVLHWTLLGLFLLIIPTGLTAQDLSLQALVTPSTIVMKDGRPVTFAIHGFIEFKSLAEVFPYIESQMVRWRPDGRFTVEERRLLARELLRHAIESRVVSMTDEQPLEILLTHTAAELRQAIARVKEAVPPGYTEAFLEVQEKWKHSLNCWSASPSIPARVLSNWYPIEEGIELYGATYDSTEHFWQAVKYHPDVTVAQLIELLAALQQKDWSGWLARLDADPRVYQHNAYAIEFLRHNLQADRLQWFHDELGRHGLRPSERAREAQQRRETSFRFSAFEEKVLWGDLADVFHMVYHFSDLNDPMKGILAAHHFDGVYLGERKMDFISPEFRSLMLEIWKVKYLQIPRFREVITSIPKEIVLSHFLNDGDSPDIPIPIYVQYLNQIRELALGKVRRKNFRKRLGPAEPLQGQHKRNPSPQSQHQQARPLLEQRRTFENAGAQRVVQGGEGQGFDQGMDDGGESFVGKEDAGKNPHGHHHDVHNAAGGFDFLSATGGEQA